MSTRHFSIRKMLRNTTNPLLQRFFHRSARQLNDINWSKMPGHCEHLVLPIINQLPPEVHKNVETLFSEVHELASESGIHSIIEAARRCDVPDFVQNMPQANCFNLAMWAWLEYPPVFEEALVLEKFDSLTGSYKRLGLPHSEPDRSTLATEGLARGISNLLQAEEGRGGKCSVFHRRRNESVDIYVAHPDDFLNSITVHDDNGNLQSKSIRPTFEIVFAFNHREGELELFTKMATPLKKSLVSMFGQIILNADIDPHQFQCAYDLNRLRDRGFSLNTDPEDRVKVDVAAAWFNAKSRGKIGLVPTNGYDILKMANHFLNDSNTHWNRLNLQKATLGFQFEGRRGRRASSLKLDISYPNHCTIRSRRPEYVEIVRKYLRHWRIARV